jgi:hypothetical protein
MSDTPRKDTPGVDRSKEVDVDCAAFQDRLPELFESHTDLSKEEHLRSCENCAALVRDLEYIAQQAKLLLPIHDPRSRGKVTPIRHSRPPAIAPSRHLP